MNCPFYHLSLDGLSQTCQKGRILVAESWNVTPHIETGAEISIRLAKSGYRVDYVFYGHLLPYVECFDNAGRSLKSRLIYGEKSPQSKVEHLLASYASSHKIDLRVLAPPARISCHDYSIPNTCLASLDKLQNYSTKCYRNIGISVASSLVSHFKDSNILPYLHEDFCNKLATSYLRSYKLIDFIAANGIIDGVILFNGRFTCVKGAADYCQRNKIQVYYHERGSSKHKFFLNSYQPHDRIKVQADALKAYQEFGSLSSKTIDLARAFFERRRQGADEITKHFSFEQVSSATHLVAEARAASRSGKVLTFYSSSDDEFLSVNDAFKRSNFEWKTQIQAFSSFAEIALNQGHSVILRQHPRLALVSASDASNWSDLEFIEYSLRNKIFNVSFDCNISSYELMDLSDIIVCHGSTIGIEAVYWGKPCILLSNSFYDQMGASLYQPRSRYELHKLLSSNMKLQVVPESAIPYGSYFASFGIEHAIFKPDTNLSGSIFGVNISDVGNRSKSITSSKQKLAAFIAKFINGNMAIKNYSKLSFCLFIPCLLEALK